MPAFSFDSARRKRKSYQKENAVGKFRSLRRAIAVSSAALDKLLKKLEQNFQKLCLQYNKIKSFHGSGELSVKASLEKITHYAVFTA